MYDFSWLSRCAAPIRIGVFLLVLLLLWLPLALLLYGLARQFSFAGVLALVLLYLEFIGLAQFWGRRVYGRSNSLRAYGLVWSWQAGREYACGFSLGLISLSALFLTQVALGWTSWQPLSPGLGRIALEGLLMATALAFVEELLFRGWLLEELDRDYRPRIAVWTSAIVYAGLHRMTWQFPALVLLGLTLAWAKRATCPQRLALPMGIHAGLVWSYYMVTVGQLIDDTGQVPVWVTGLDRNPLAGVMGFGFMGILALCVRRRSPFSANLMLRERD